MSQKRPKKLSSRSKNCCPGDGIGIHNGLRSRARKGVRVQIPPWAPLDMLKIRQFKLSDLLEIMEIEKVSFLKSQAYPKSYFLRYFKKYSKGFTVAESNGEILGYMIGGIKNKRGEFISLAIKPEFRQKGIGVKLTNFLINLFKKEDIKDIVLNVRTKNKIAIAFYDKLGFEIVKKVKKYYLNGDDAYIMRKDLDG